MLGDPLGGADQMRWPGIRAKLFPVTVIRVPLAWPWISFGFRNWYHGCWWQACIGPWVILGGSGNYDHLQQEAGDA